MWAIAEPPGPAYTGPMVKFKRRRSGQPLPDEGASSYVDRYRGTEWDTGIVDAKPPGDPLSVNIMSAILIAAIAFGVLIAFWLLLGFTS